MFVPGAEAAGPPSGDVHDPELCLVASHMSQEVHAPVEEHPPGLGGLVLLEQFVTALEGHLGAHLEQGLQQVVVAPVEEPHPAKIVELHHIVAR